MTTHNKKIDKEKKKLKRINKILREERLINEAKFGRLRSKVWDYLPSNKKQRRTMKNKLKKITNNKTYEEDLNA